MAVTRSHQPAATTIPIPTAAALAGKRKMKGSGRSGGVADSGPGDIDDTVLGAVTGGSGTHKLLKKREVLLAAGEASNSGAHDSIMGTAEMGRQLPVLPGTPRHRPRTNGNSGMTGSGTLPRVYDTDSGSSNARGAHRAPIEESELSLPRIRSTPTASTTSTLLLVNGIGPPNPAPQHGQGTGIPTTKSSRSHSADHTSAGSGGVGAHDTRPPAPNTVATAAAAAVRRRHVNGNTPTRLNKTAPSRGGGVAGQHLPPITSHRGTRHVKGEKTD